MDAVVVYRANCYLCKRISVKTEILDLNIKQAKSPTEQYYRTFFNRHLNE